MVASDINSPYNRLYCKEPVCALQWAETDAFCTLTWNLNRKQKGRLIVRTGICPQHAIAPPCEVKPFVTGQRCWIRKYDEPIFGRLHPSAVSTCCDYVAG